MPSEPESHPAFHPAPIVPVAADPSASIAFLLLRLFLGLRTLMSGVEKFESGGSYSFGNYSVTMNRMAEGITGASFLPLWATRAFALPLGFILVFLGVALLLGLKTRAILSLLGLVYIGLAFGLMAVQEGEGVAWIGVHVLMIVAALVLCRHNRFALWPDRHVIPAAR